MPSIRPYDPTDLAALEQIFLRARIAAFHWMDSECFRLSDFSTQTEGEAITVAVDESGQPLGFISVWVEDHFIHHLYISPQHQGFGIGTLLLESLYSWLPKPYRLKCLIASTEAYAFYVKRGWQVIGYGTDSLGDYTEMSYP